MTNELGPVRLPDGQIIQSREIRAGSSVFDDVPGVPLAQRMRQRPSIGRVVLFTTGGDPVNGSVEFVAIIGQVFEDTGDGRPYCNLLVMAPFAAPYWEGSVKEYDESAALAALDDPHPPRARTWRWPPRS